MKNGRKRGMLPRELYSQIHSLMPIVCVDLAFVRDGKVLLVKRKIEPLKNQWYVPGGRLFRWETVREAITRISRAESGLTAHDPVFVRYDELRFGRDPFGHGKGTHTVSLLFAVECRAYVAKLDANHSSYGWFEPDELEPGTVVRNLPVLMSSAIDALMKRERCEL